MPNKAPVKLTTSTYQDKTITMNMVGELECKNLRQPKLTFLFGVFVLISPLVNIFERLTMLLYNIARKLMNIARQKLKNKPSHHTCTTSVQQIVVYMTILLAC